MATRLKRITTATDGALRRALVALAALTGLTLVGTVGFRITEGIGWLDALYMAVITLSTVGYQEVAPASLAGRVFTIGFIVVGVSVALYAGLALAEFWIEGRVQEMLGRRAMKRSIESLRKHVIVCGYGRLGRSVVERLEREDQPLVVVEVDPGRAGVLEEAGRIVVEGSALEDDVLRTAGIERAQAIVIATPEDADNVFIALSARELNPEIAVHARAETEAGVRRLRLAGADQVISPHGLGGQRIAQAIVRPAVVDFLELSAPGAEAPIDLEEVALAPGCGLAGRTLGQVSQDLGISLVALKRPGTPTRLQPPPDEVLQAGDHLVVVGDQSGVERLARLAQAP